MKLIKEIKKKSPERARPSANAWVFMVRQPKNQVAGTKARALSPLGSPATRTMSDSNDEQQRWPSKPRRLLEMMKLVLEVVRLLDKLL